MQDQDLKRLGKGAHEKRADISSIHIKDDFVEVTNGAMIYRETVPTKAKEEQVIDRKTLKPVDKPFPDLGAILKKNSEKPTIFKMAFSKSVFEQFVAVLPDRVTKIVFEIKGAESPLMFSAPDIEGLLMPMTLEQPGKVPEAEKETPAPDEHIVKIIIENGEVVAVEGLPEGYKYEAVKKQG